jgi:amidase
VSELPFLSALEQAALIRRRELSPVELVQTYLDRIERLDGELRAYVTVCGEQALADAQLAEQANGGALPPFHGVPIAIKDLAATAGIRTTFSCRALADYVPAFDTAVVRRLRQAGFILLGKTNTPEFGTIPVTESELNGDCRNPWNPELTPGGSSGGSAAAVAAGLCPVAQGGDGGGSIRIPASCCGLFGLKPSRGRVSSAPVVSFEGLSTLGPITRTVADAAALLDVMAGYEPGDPWWAPEPERPFAEEIGRPPERLRIAVTSRPPVDVDVDPACRAAAEEAGRLLEELGHEVEEAVPPWDEADLLETFLLVWQALPTIYAVADQTLLTPLNRELVRRAQATPSPEYLAATQRLQTLARAIVPFWAQYDVLVTPTLALPPVPIGWLTDYEVDEQLTRAFSFTPFTPVANATGQPAASVPLGWQDGLPLGVQLIGPPAEDALVLRLSAQLEEARPWHHHRPPLS